MVDKKITELTALSTPATDDVIPIVDISGTETKKITVANIIGMVLLEQHTASSSATLDFTTGITSAYDDYIAELINVLPATDSVQLLLRFSTDGCANYAAANYIWQHLYIYGAGVVNWESSSSDTGICVGGAAVSNTNAGVCGTIRLHNPGAAGTTFKSVTMDTTRYVGAIPALVHDSPNGGNISIGAVDAIRFLFSSGNIASGTIRLYGLMK